MDGTSLILNSAERTRAAELLARFTDSYENSLTSRPIAPDADRETLAKLLAEPFPEEGLGVEAFFADVVDRLVPYTTTIAHPRFLAYVQGPPNGIGAYAEAIAAVLNQNCNLWQISPAANVIERSVMDWLTGLFAMGPASGGILTSGGSGATKDAITTAIANRRPDFRERGLQENRAPLVLYTSDEAHRSVVKAATLLGIGLANVRAIPTDAHFQLRVDLLTRAIAEDRAAGKEPFCVVATAGTVTTGSIDPIGPIADLCEKENLWLHVDGAYGALFVLADSTRDALLPLSRADSVTLDPHKLLFAPLEAGALLVKDMAKLRAAFAFSSSSSYLTAIDDAHLLDYMDHGPQLSRSFKALKVWAALRTFGVGTFRSVTERCLTLANRLGAHIAAAPGLELMNPVTLTAVCVRMPGRTAEAHAELLTRLHEEGTAMLGPAKVNGQPCVRACVTNHRTTEADIDLLANRLTALAAL
ncbi:aminotransferase class V-fold PLP-dependent enzyme [Amycolatopsis rubida]|uniref:Aminotransferase class V-fold PLP-dependent enzyme n=1 Tax=Amycolatopsis rubida TaxID=112413 RepID=A0A1I5DW24_9PSEU|nr:MULTISPECIES: pyridoxal-dependent decarboxylase [Amycolatopsis]MYW92590.1 aminotransferase class V-fold PLP-dependent enzyme [Amycolatopsis rubida]NEC57575.1 aminotransferase class V-fold PLP-dependent enzyme [Amycolatopsis rubida]OAP20318.1 L-2,4-diaminobutyrate decarboxylase [Amycolatopsis sp. M39]SFO02941.1 aromatic-L-amino-acid decarboxylase [Amycolatopsis rubida]